MSTVSPRPSGRSGFTLLETVVAMAILALSFAALLRGVSTDLRLVDRGQEQTLALLYAKSKMDEVMAWSDLSAGQWQGSYDDGFRWRVSVIPENEGLPAARLYSIMVSVGRNLDTNPVRLDTSRLSIPR